MPRTVLRIVSLFALTGVLGADANFRSVKPQLFESEKKVVRDPWILDFTFRSPRYIMANIPGKGRELVWYMRYTVVNTTDKPRLLIPKFTLVTHSRKGDEIRADVILPRAEEAVINREDPTRRFPLRNSVTISEEIPPTPTESQPIAWHGVAFWQDVDMSARSFTVYVTGLSNLYSKQEDVKTKKELLRRKTLKLEFSKPGDVFNPDEKEIRFISAEWIYR